MLINNNFLETLRFHFKLSPVRGLFTDEEAFLLETIGLPEQILAANYDYLELPYIDADNNSIVIGTNRRMPAWKLRIDMETRSIFTYGLNENGPPTNWFYNSSLRQFFLSIFARSFFLNRLVLKQSLGAYDEHHEKYAKLLEEMIIEIDEIAVKKGVWWGLLEEMKLGVI